MKKIYLIVLTLALMIPSYGQTVAITRVIDGVQNATCTGGLGNGRPKMVEFRVDGTIDFGAVNDNGTPMDPMDDIVYNFEVDTNGDASGGIDVWNQNSLVSIGIVTDGYFYAINDAAGSGQFVFESMYPAGEFLPQLNTGMFINGNDPVRITDNMGVVLDQFGRGSDVGATGDYDNPWNYEDRVAIRNDGSAPNGGSFSESNWTFQAAAWASDGSVTCAIMASDISFGTTVLTVPENDIVNFVMYPNPVIDGEFRINTGTLGNVQKSIQIYNMLGKQVYNNSKSLNDTPIDVSNLTSGIYILKVEEDGKLATRKLIIE